MNLLGLFRRRDLLAELSLAELCSDGFRSVVGESHYQQALRKTQKACHELLDGRPLFTAALIAERDNAYDPNAIAVLSPSGKLGYLARDDAHAYRELFDKIRELGYDGGSCRAHLTGGERGKPTIGVVLRLANPATCLEELSG